MSNLRATNAGVAGKTGWLARCNEAFGRNTMSQIKKKLEAEVEREVAELEHASDEIALKLHLAEMDAKTICRRLEKNLLLLEERINREAAHLADTTKAVAKDMRQSLKELESRL
jgi:hypothetical protein